MREYDEQLAAQAERYSQLGDEELQLLIDREQMGMEVAMNDSVESPSGVSTAGGSAPMWNTDPGLVDSASRLASPTRSMVEDGNGNAVPEDDDGRSVATHTSHLSDMSRPLEPTMLNAQHPTAGMLGHL